METTYLQPFFDFAWKYINHTKTSKDLIIQNAHYQTFQKGDQILREGIVCHHLYFPIKGYARSFHFHKDKEITYWIYPERYLFTSWSSYLRQQPSFEAIEALEEMEVIVFKYADLQEMFNQSNDIERLFRLTLEQHVSSLEEYFKVYNFMSAKEKYSLILQYMPDLDQRVNLGYIASMLGISQETLSRVRSK